LNPLQFLVAGRYGGNVVDGKVTKYGGQNKDRGKESLNLNTVISEISGSTFPGFT
jgi:hypothetical protein